MKKEYNKLFDRISPQSSNEEFLSQILGKAEKMENRKKISFKKPVVIGLAAAFTLTAATVTVGAATGWDFNGGFDAVFKNRAERYIASPDYQEYKSGFDFAKYGKELDLHYTFDDYNLNIYGVIADESTAYVMYDVVFDEGFDYKEKKDYTEWDMNAILETADLAMNTNEGKLISVDGNRFTFYQMATSGKEGLNLADNTLVLNLYRLERGIEQSLEYDELYSESQTVECGLTVEIPVDFSVYNSITVDVNEENSKAYLIDYVNNERVKVEAELQKIAISPLNCDFTFMTDIADDGLEKGEAYSLDEFFFTDKNGEIISYTPHSYSISVEETGVMRFNVNLTQPVEPDEIASVTVGGTTIYLN